MLIYGMFKVWSQEEIYRIHKEHEEVIEDLEAWRIPKMG